MTILKFVLKRVGDWLSNQARSIYERARSWLLTRYEKVRNPDDSSSSS